MATWGYMREQVLKAHPEADLDSITDWLGQAYEYILSQRDWIGLKGRDTLQTGSVYSTGTIAVEEGSDAVVGTATAWDVAQTGLLIQISGRNELYTLTITDATTATLDRDFEGEDNDEATYKLFQRDYELSSLTKSVTRINNPQLGLDLEEKDRDELLSRVVQFGQPTFYALAPEEGEESPRKIVTIWPVPETAMGLHYDIYQSALGFSGLNTFDSPLPFVSSGFLQNFAIALGHTEPGMRAASMQVAQMFEQSMHNEENRKVPPTKLKAASRYTRHERARRSW